MSKGEKGDKWLNQSSSIRVSFKSKALSLSTLPLIICMVWTYNAHIRYYNAGYRTVSKSGSDRCPAKLAILPFLPAVNAGQLAENQSGLLIVV